LCEVLSKHLFDVEAELQVGVQGNDLPAFYARREEVARTDLRRAEELSIDYLRALQLRGTQLSHGKVMWTRDENGKVKIFGQEEFVALQKNSVHSLEAWYRWQNVVVTTETMCDCILYRKNPFAFCRHSIAVRHYTHMINSPLCLSPLTPSPSQPQRTEVSSSVRPSLPQREPLTTLESNSKSLVSTRPPTKRHRRSLTPADSSPRAPTSTDWNVTGSWHRPSPRRTANSLRAQSVDLGL